MSTTPIPLASSVSDSLAGGNATNPAPPAATEIVHVDGARRELRLLDQCLQFLEDAHERGETEVSVGVANRFGTLVDGLVPGMSIDDALELVFRRQEDYMRHAPPNNTVVWKARVPDPGPNLRAGQRSPVVGLRGIRVSRRESSQGLADEVDSVEPFTETEARALTEKIQAEVGQVSLLLLEAHQHHAWSALGYRTWEGYVRGELGLSRSRSYELLDHGRVIRAIKYAAGMSGIPDISAHAAAQIKAGLPEITKRIRLETAGESEEQKRKAVRNVIEEARTVFQKEGSDWSFEREVVSRADGDPCPPQWRDQLQRPNTTAIANLTSLYAAIEYLATLPSIRSVVDQIPETDAHRLIHLPEALRWLQDFADEWSTRTGIVHVVQTSSRPSSH